MLLAGGPQTVTNEIAWLPGVTMDEASKAGYLSDSYMNTDLIEVLEFFEREKGISRENMVSAVEEALKAAAKKAFGPARNLRCQIDLGTGDIKVFVCLTVDENVRSKHDEISLVEAHRTKPEAQLGEEIEVEVTPANFGQIASQNAKLALMKHLEKSG